MSMDAEVAVADRPGKPRTTFRRTWSRSTRSRQVFVIVGGLIVAAFLIAAIAPGLLTSQNPNALYAGRRQPRLAPGTGWAPMSSAGTSMRDWSMARGHRSSCPY
jgi:hypothetical protein